MQLRNWLLFILHLKVNMYWKNLFSTTNASQTRLQNLTVNQLNKFFFASSFIIIKAFVEFSKTSAHAAMCMLFMWQL